MLFGSSATRSADAATLVAHIVRNPVAAFDYRYELRRGEEVVATGHLTPDRPLEAGERIEIGGAVGTIRAIEPLLGERELRLVVEMWREAT